MNKILVIVFLLLSTNSFSQEKQNIGFYNINGILPLGNDTVYSKYTKNIEKLSDKVYLFDKKIKVEYLFPTRKDDPNFIFSQTSVQDGLAENVKKLFKVKFNKALNLKLGESITTSGIWKNSYYSNISELDLLYGTGGYSLTSKINMTVSRGNTKVFNGYSVSGSIVLTYNDTYNWDAGKGDYVPGVGYTDDNDFDLLTVYKGAQNFELKSTKTINFSFWVYTQNSIMFSIIRQFNTQIDH